MKQNKSQRCKELLFMMFKALSNETNEIFPATAKGNLSESAFKALNIQSHGEISDAWEKYFRQLCRSNPAISARIQYFTLVPGSQEP